MCEPCKVICECEQINWTEKYRDDYEHDDSKCECCHSKMNRNEISHEQYISICKMSKRKHVYPPCTWY